MGYKGADITELIFDGYHISAEAILGSEPGRGSYQMMDGVEVGRVNVAARGCGVARRAFELAIGYAQQRETFGKKMAEHQATQFRIADMAVKVEAAHQMMVMAARTKDSGRRNDLEAGMRSTWPASTARRSSRTLFGFTADTGTPRSTKSSACTETLRCCSSVRARPTSSA
jgi:alkylation response protein AidB-like acyl-CoA dehydrogenase